MSLLVNARAKLELYREGDYGQVQIPCKAVSDTALYAWLKSKTDSKCSGLTYKAEGTRLEFHLSYVSRIPADLQALMAAIILFPGQDFKEVEFKITDNGVCKTRTAITGCGRNNGRVGDWKHSPQHSQEWLMTTENDILEGRPMRDWAQDLASTLAEAICQKYGEQDRELLELVLRSMVFSNLAGVRMLVHTPFLTHGEPVKNG